LTHVSVEEVPLTDKESEDVDDAEQGTSPELRAFHDSSHRHTRLFAFGCCQVCVSSVEFDKVDVLANVVERSDKDTREEESETEHLEKVEITADGSFLLESSEFDRLALFLCFFLDVSVSARPNSTCQFECEKHGGQCPFHAVFKILTESAINVAECLVCHSNSQEDMRRGPHRDKAHDQIAVNGHGNGMENIPAVFENETDNAERSSKDVTVFGVANDVEEGREELEEGEHH